MVLEWITGDLVKYQTRVYSKIFKLKELLWKNSNINFHKYHIYI